MSSETSVRDSALLLNERRGRVALLTFNRPERLNAWTDALEAQYFGQLAELDSDPEVGAVVVTGAGRGFCAGADMHEMQENDGSEELQPPSHGYPLWFPLTLRKPLVAAINGPAAGIGLVHALYCDLRFVAPEAKLTTSFSRRGLVAEYGMSWLLPRLVGGGRAADLLLSGRVVLGEEAHRFGLAEFLAARETIVADAVAYAQDLTDNCSPTSMAVIKEQIRADFDRPLSQALAAAHDELAAALRRPDFAEGVRSYSDQRLPNFPPLPSSTDS